MIIRDIGVHLRGKLGGQKGGHEVEDKVKENPKQICKYIKSKRVTEERSRRMNLANPTLAQIIASLAFQQSRMMECISATILTT